MTVVAVVSGKGSPGCTTLAAACALSIGEPASVLLIEADPSGGSLAARWSLGTEPGLVELATAVRRSSAESGLVRRLSQPVAPNVSVLPCPADPDAVVAALTTSSPGIAGALAAWDGLVLVDAGRLDARSPANELVAHADVVAVVLRPMLDQITTAIPRVAALRRAGAQPEVVVVGTSPYQPFEVSAYLDAPLLTVVGDDPAVAEAFWIDGAGSRAVRRSRWWRSVLDTAGILDGRHQSAPQQEVVLP